MTGDQRPTDINTQLTQRLDINLALQAAGLGVWEVDLITNQVRWDDQCRQLFGMDQNQLSYADTLPRIHPDDVDRVNQALAEARDAQSDGTYQVTYRTLGDDGHTRWIQSTGRRYVDPAGQPVRLAGVAQDVTGQLADQEREDTNRQQALRQQRIAQAITASSPDLMYVFDRSYRFTYANQALLDMWGSTWEQSMGKSLLEIGYEPWHAQMHEREIDQVVATKQPIRGEVSFPHASLGPRIYDYVFSPVLNQSGEVEAVAGTTRDVTDLLHTQQLLQQSEARFRSLIEEAPVATCLFVGRQMVIEMANPAMIQVWGKGPGVIGLPLAEALPELKQQHFLSTLDTLFTTGNSYQAKGGRADLVVGGRLQTFYFNYDFKPLRTPEGEVYAILETAQDVTEQVLAGQHIEQSQRQLLDLFEQSPVALATISADEQLVFQWANPFYGELVARTPQALVGKPLLEALPELKGQGFDEFLKQVIATGTPFSAPEVAVDILRDGQLTTIYVDLTYQPRKGTQGEITGILVVATDVTQQVISRQTVEESESKLRAILATAPAGIGVFVGRELVIENPNQTFIDIVGKGLHVAGLPLREVMPELVSEGQPFLQILDDVFTTGEPFLSPSSLVKIVKNGVLRDNYYNISYSPIRNAKGEVYAILDIAIDVTAEVKARQQLEETQVSLREAVELAQLGTWSIDVASQGLRFSDRLIEWFGYDPGAQAYQQVIPILDGDDQERVDRAVAWALNPASDGVYNEIYTVIHPQTGQKRILHARGKTVFDAAGNPVRLNGTAQDITLQRELQLALEQQVQQRTEELAAANEELAATNEELEASNEEYAALNEELEEANGLLMRSNENLQTFAYVASHDLQEPLRKVQQFGNLLAMGKAGLAEDQQLYVERMQSAASRMSTLIRDLLNFSRLSTQPDTQLPVALSEVVDRVLTTLELLITETQAQVTVGPLPTVAGDAAQLDMLFQNLVSNALKFRRMDALGEAVAPVIEMRASLLADQQLPPTVRPARLARAYHLIEVVDNGIGFDEHYLDRIFQVFQRLHNKRDYAGTGIGLAICERVVTNHGGAITASSQPGQGATFQVYLPV